MPRTRCPHCGRTVAVKSDGTLWRHRWVIPGKVQRGPYAGEWQPWCPGVDTDQLNLLAMCERALPGMG